MNNFNIYVGRLSSSVNEAKLRSLFEQYGEVLAVKLIKDKFTGQLKGFGFVEMADAAQGQEAINALNGMDIDGQRMLVSEARPREQRAPRPFGGNREGGFRGPRNPRFGGNRY